MRRKLPTLSRFFRAFLDLLHSIAHVLYCFLLYFFRNLNLRIGSRLAAYHMELETRDHLDLLTKVFIYLILPFSILYVCSEFCIFHVNAWDSMSWGIAVYFYSQMLPDLPSIFRKKQDGHDLSNGWKYILLLLAPLFVWLLFSDIRLNWRTAETFHNFRSVIVYSVFLVLCGFLGFTTFPLSIGTIVEAFSLSLYGVLGYLTHLKVDKIW